MSIRSYCVRILPHFHTLLDLLVGPSNPDLLPTCLECLTIRLQEKATWVKAKNRRKIERSFSWPFTKR